MEYAVTATSFRLLACERCGSETLQALRADYRICSGCEPAALERVAFEAGRSELLR
jgi:hypothetical protein